MITPAPGWMIDPNNPNGVVRAGSVSTPVSVQPISQPRSQPTPSNAPSMGAQVYNSPNNSWSSFQPTSQPANISPPSNSIPYNNNNNSGPIGANYPGVTITGSGAGGNSMSFGNATDQLGASNTQNLGNTQTFQGDTSKYQSNQVGVGGNLSGSQNTNNQTNSQNSSSGSPNFLSNFLNSPQTQQYNQSQTDTLTRLQALQGQLAQSGVQSPAEMGLQNQINQVTNAQNNNTILSQTQNPNFPGGGLLSLANADIANNNIGFTQNLANLVLAKSVLAQQRNIQSSQLGAQATALESQATIGQQLRQNTMFGGLPPDIASAIIQKQLFPQQQITTDVYGQPQAVTFNPTGGVQGTQPVGAQLFGGNNTGNTSGNSIGGVSGTDGNRPAVQNIANFPTTTLQPGSTNTVAVKQLQDYLVSGGYMTQAQVNTGYGTYGPQTQAAVQQLQQKLGINNTSGPGSFGPQTLAALQSKNNQNTSSLPTNSQQNPLSSIAQQVANGQMSYETAQGMFSTPGQRVALNQAIQAINPNFSPTNSQANYTATQNALANAVPLVQAQQTAIDHLNSLSNDQGTGIVDKVKYAGGFGSPAINFGRDVLSNYLNPDPNIQQLKSAIGVVRGEVAKVLGGGTASVEALNEAQQVIPDNISPDNFKQVKQKVIDLMNSKIKEYTSTGNVAQFGTQNKSNQTQGGGWGSLGDKKP